MKTGHQQQQVPQHNTINTTNNDNNNITSVANNNHTHNNNVDKPQSKQFLEVGSVSGASCPGSGDEVTDSSSVSDEMLGSGDKHSSRGASPEGESHTRRKRTSVTARERNVRRLESNERERMRMHSLNDAFQVRV